MKSVLRRFNDPSSATRTPAGVIGAPPRIFSCPSPATLVARMTSPRRPVFPNQSQREKLYTDSDFLRFEKYSYNRRFEDSTNKKIYDINLVAIMIRRLVASIYFRNPTLLVRSLSPEGDWSVPIITRLWKVAFSSNQIT